jgi:hypothetical protein
LVNHTGKSDGKTIKQQKPRSIVPRYEALRLKYVNKENIG